MSLTAHRGEILHFTSDPLVDGAQSWQYWEDGLLVIEDGYVVVAGSFQDCVAWCSRVEKVNEHKNGLIIPGLVDTHVHYPQCEIIAAYGTQLLDWLERYTFPTEQQFHDRGHGASVAEFFLNQLLSNGTTTALVFGTVHPESVEAFFDAALQRNLRMICGKVMMDRNAPSVLCDTPDRSYHESRKLIRQWHGKARLGYAVTPRFAPTSSSAQLTRAAQLVSEFAGVHLHTHLAENQQECEWVRILFPTCNDYLDVYDQFGLLGRRSVFAHGIHLSNSEWTRLKTSRSNIAFCPTSNLFIGSGLFDLSKADQFEVSVGLGTDIGGGDSFSILRTINEAYKVQQLQGYNLSPFRSLYLATLGGARALDLHRQIGNFDNGKEADFIVLDYHSSPLMQFRINTCRTFEEKLFVLQMLGDDRTVRETWIMGQKQQYNWHHKTEITT